MRHKLFCEVKSANLNAAMELEQCRVTLVTSGIQAMLSCFMIFVIHISEIWWLTKALSGIGVMNSYPGIGIDAEAILLEFANRETHNEVQIGRKTFHIFLIWLFDCLLQQLGLFLLLCVFVTDIFNDIVV